LVFRKNISEQNGESTKAKKGRKERKTRKEGTRNSHRKLSHVEKILLGDHHVG